MPVEQSKRVTIQYTQSFKQRFSYDSMKVAMYYRNDDIRIEEMPRPAIESDEILVEMRACGICGSDVLEWYRLKTAPRVLGHEMTGIVAEVGHKVKDIAIGDRIFVSHHVPCGRCRFCHQGKHTLCATLHSTNIYPGGFAEYIRIPAINVACGTFQLPDTVSYARGTFIEPLACTLRGLRIARFTKGQSVLILGSGVAGLLHVKLLKAQGASFIATTDISSWRLAKAKSFGADLALNASQDILEQLKAKNDHHPDLVILCTGALSAIAQAAQIVGAGSTLLIFAPSHPEAAVPFPLFDLWNKQVAIVSTYAAAPDDLQQAVDLLADKVVNVDDMITHRLPLKEAQRGFELVSRAENSLKVILENHSKH
jgi:L-iditol 2-dehydrogenase